MLHVKDIRNIFIKKYNNNEFIEDKNTNIKVIEIIGETFIADEDYIIRKPNYDYIQKELNWYKSQSLNIFKMDNPPKIWKQICSTNGQINSNYGWCIFSIENYSQYDNVLKELINNKNSRRATMIYNRPSMHYDYNVNGMDDFICTYANQFFIRDNKLISHYIMRSNDVVFGYNNDYAWAKYVQTKLYNDLKQFYPKLTLGEIIWTASSLHLYERHFKYLKDKNRE